MPGGEGIWGGTGGLIGIKGLGDRERGSLWSRTPGEGVD